MCEIFVKADPALYQSRARSIRLHGAVTSVRLENLFWQVLQEVAERDGMNTNQLITKLYDELAGYRGSVDNFSSFLRVCCLRYLSLMVDGDISTDKNLPLAGMRAAKLPAAEGFLAMHAG
ncbi:ribbon-helix-helix domain-containing protein [Undibacterium sp.]|jgi:predicted DNA-binding ribbon-helix-helix protein|uniref:ribbon-helix-helix domain-containing protein n=1 Tax=Undibacterium sp. TaxID=1914977 RepID=UPI002CAEF436|nr:ribbon-helix-helix domain-containing protein [Undibacterium sp.]HTD03923.1 ribbon-helix-helix domain-containing protein [Undibacterium sp.]